MTAGDEDGPTSIDDTVRRISAQAPADRFTREEFLAAAGEIGVDKATAQASWDEYLAHRTRPAAVLPIPAGSRLLVEGTRGDRLVIEIPPPGPETEATAILGAALVVASASIAGIALLPWPASIFLGLFAAGAIRLAYRAYRTIYGRLRLTLTPEGGILEQGPARFVHTVPLTLSQIRCRIERPATDLSYVVLSHGVRDYVVEARLNAAEQDYLIAVVDDWLLRYA
jgi:hypothetical protein